MATTITPATLTVDIKESISLGGVQRNDSSTMTIANVKNIFRRIVTASLASTGTILLSFNEDNDGGADDAVETIPSFDIAAVKYIRITNLDDTNNVLLHLKIDTGGDYTTADDMITLLLEPGKSYMYGCPHASIGVDDDAAAAINTGFVDLEGIAVLAPHGASYTHADIGVYVAST